MSSIPALRDGCESGRRTASHLHREDKNTPIYLGAQSVRVSPNVAMSLSQTGRGNGFLERGRSIREKINETFLFYRTGKYNIPYDILILVLQNSLAGLCLRL